MEKHQIANILQLEKDSLETKLKRIKNLCIKKFGFPKNKIDDYFTCKIGYRHLTTYEGAIYLEFFNEVQVVKSNIAILQKVAKFLEIELK